MEPFTSTRRRTGAVAISFLIRSFPTSISRLIGRFQKEETRASFTWALNVLGNVEASKTAVFAKPFLPSIIRRQTVSTSCPNGQMMPIPVITTLSAICFFLFLVRHSTFNRVLQHQRRRLSAISIAAAQRIANFRIPRLAGDV